MDELGERTGRHYGLVDYSGHPEAERVLVVMGSGGETARETVAFLQAQGERVGVAQVRLYRPFPAGALAAALPASVRRVAVLDRTKEPGSLGEPLFLDVLAALSESHADGERELMPRVIGGRYGLSSKEFTPGDGRRRARGAGARAAQAAVHDRDHTTTSPARACPMTPRLTSSRRRRCARCSSAWAPTGRSARTRTRSRSSATRKACTRRATSSMTPRSPARRPSRTCASGRSRSEPRTSSRRRASSAATSSACSSATEVLERAAPGATLLLNCQHPPGPGVGRAVAPGPGADPRQADRALRDRRGPDRARGGPRRADQHGPSDLLLRDLGRARTRHRRSSGSRHRSPKTYGKRGAEVVERNQHAVDHALQRPSPGGAARAGDAPA